MSRPNRALTASSFLSNYNSGVQDENQQISDPYSRHESHGLQRDNSESSFESSNADLGWSYSRSSLGISSPHAPLNSTLSTSAPSPFYMPESDFRYQRNMSASPLSPAARFLGSPQAIGSQYPVQGDGRREVGMGYEEVVHGYTLGPTIGLGGSSVIRRAHSSAGGIVAVKIVHLAGSSADPFSASPSRSRKHERQLRQEAQIWASLTHEHILPLFFSSFGMDTYSEHDPKFSLVYFVTLYCPAGSLFDIMQRSSTESHTLKMPHDDAGMMFRQVVRGLRYLHERMRLVHGDIKLENVLVDESGVCRIADFGMSKWMDDSDHRSSEDSSSEPDKEGRFTEYSQLKEREGILKPIHRSLRRSYHVARDRNTSMPVPSITYSQSLREKRHNTSRRYKFPKGSLPYVSPELLTPTFSSLHSASPTRSGTDPAQDIWALGVLLYVLLAGTFPFHDSYEPRLVDKIVRGSFRTPVGIGTLAEDILHGCLSLDLVSRWTVAHVDENAWGVGWGDISTPSSAVVTPSTKDRPTSTRTSSADYSSPSLLQTTMPTRLPPLPRSADPDPDQESRGRGTAPVVRASRASLNRDSSRSRSTSRPPFAASHSDPHTMPLDPVTTRVSISVERGRKRNTGRGRDAAESRSPSPSAPPTTPRDGSRNLFKDRKTRFEIELEHHSENGGIIEDG